MIYYQDDHITIYHGEARDILPTMGEHDLLFTDPPYGIGESGSRSNRNRAGDDRWKAPTNKDYGENAWDAEPVAADLLWTARGLCQKQVIWGGQYYELPPCRGWLIWDKESDGKNGADCEMAWNNVITSNKRIVWLWDGFRQKQFEERQHPTQKPLGVIAWALSQVKDVKTILDPFAGSGTTGRAAKDLGLHCTMIEREERYCEIAAKRMAQEVLF